MRSTLCHTLYLPMEASANTIIGSRANHLELHYRSKLKVKTAAINNDPKSHEPALPLAIMTTSHTSNMHGR